MRFLCYSSRRLRVAAAATIAVTFLVTGCAGEPSPVTKLIAADAARMSEGKDVAVFDIHPATGSVSGGTATITGANLENIAVVRVGDQGATITTSTSGTVVVAVPSSQSFATGTVPITVIDSNGEAVPTDGKTYDYHVQTPVDKQLAYAMAHWQDYNSAEYGDLNPVGGDCANFVSQTLIARGWTMNSDWYNNGAGDDWSPAWGYVPTMDAYFTANAAQLGLTRYSFDQRDNIRVGDIVMLDWNDNDSLDHVQIVSSVQTVNGVIEIKMVGHNEDTDYRDLDTAITVEHPGAVGHFWSLSS